jgi:hypothetical protein
MGRVIEVNATIWSVVNQPVSLFQMDAFCEMVFSPAIKTQRLADPISGFAGPRRGLAQKPVKNGSAAWWLGGLKCLDPR